MIRAIFVRIALLYTISRVCYTKIVTYYIYMEACNGRFCYAVKEINVSYSTENRDISLLCSTPMPLDEEETLPIAVFRGTNAYEKDTPNALGFTAADPKTAKNGISPTYRLCNDSTPLLFELISGESHAFVLLIFVQDNGGTFSENQLSAMIINIHPNNSITVITMEPISDYIDKQDLMLNDTSLQCSVYEDAGKRACFCKENYAREFCSHQDYSKLDPSRKGYEYYHIYGRLTFDNLLYYYYFEITTIHPPVIYVQRYSASVLLESGGIESKSLCVSYNGSASEAKYNLYRICLAPYILIPTSQTNFTAFAKLHDNNWHSLLWFDHLRWSKNYKPGNCSYEDQMLDGIVQPFVICMRRNVTEKFYKKIIQGDQTNSTLKITETTQSTPSQTTKKVMGPSSLMDQDDIEESLLRIAEMKNISREIVNEVLSTLDTFLNSTQHILQLGSSQILQSLNSIVKNSASDIDFIGDWSLVVRRHTVSCIKADPNEWPTMNKVPIKSNFGYRESKSENHASIQIPYETVCNEKKNHEYILIYYLFSNQKLFGEKDKTGPENACKLRKRTQQNVPVLSAQLVDKLTMETIHKMEIDKKYREMAKIVFPVQLAKLHGSTKLDFWEGQRWTDTKNSKMLVENDHYVYTTSHLTDFTLVVDGLEMDPILCDVALSFIFVTINFLSFVGLLMLIGYLSIKRYLPDDKTRNDSVTSRKLQKLPSKYEQTRLNYFVVLALFHLGFLLLSDSRNLFWPVTCESAAMVLYWLLLTCILITTFQSLHILKILSSNSLLENLLIYVVGRKFVLFTTLGTSTILVLVLRIAFPEFFDRQDYFCWIRPDYVVLAVILPLGFLGLNSTFIFFVIFIRIASQGNIFGIYVRFGKSSVRTIISTSTDSTENDISSGSLLSNGAKYVEKAFTLLCIQLMLGIPWICQYLTLFAPELTAAHYIFTIVIGSQGLIFFMLFCYRKIKRRHSK